MKDLTILRPAAGALLLLAAGCAATAPAPPRVGAAPVRPAATPPSRAVGAVVGQTARELETAFGAPRAALTEGEARRLQFAGNACVLDAYLYPRGGGGEHAVTHIDTRRPTGEDMDRAACVAALRAERSDSVS